MRKDKEEVIDWDKELLEAKNKLCNTRKHIEDQNKRLGIINGRDGDGVNHLLRLWENYLKLKNKSI